MGEGAVVDLMDGEYAVPGELQGMCRSIGGWRRGRSGRSGEWRRWSAGCGIWRCWCIGW